MDYNKRAILAWALPMITIPALPMTAALVPEPSTILIIGVMIAIGLVSAFIGHLFEDAK